MKIVPTIKVIHNENVILKAIEVFKKANVSLVRFVVTKLPIQEHIEFIEKFSEKFLYLTGCNLKLMLDVPYPKDKIRFEFFDDSENIMLKRNEEIFISNSKSNISKKLKSFYVNASFSKENVGQKAFVGDGDLIIKFLQVTDDFILAKCLNDANLKKGKAIASFTSSFLKNTEVEIKNKSLELIRRLKPKICVLSYIENSNDVVISSEEIKKYACYLPEIMSKIETYNASININDIISKSDSIMLARGCLAVNVGMENLPSIQRKILNNCKNKNIDVCLASNILKSLGQKSVPTRADICDLQYMINDNLDYFIITDQYGMTDRLLDALYYINKLLESVKN